MRSVLYVLTTLSVIGLAFWAYRENYATQESLSKTDKLYSDIRTAYTRLAILKAEWAYLNRPDRLRDLAEINFVSLGLLPLDTDQFGRIDQVAFPPPEQLTIVNPVDVSSDGAYP